MYDTFQVLVLRISMLKIVVLLQKSYRIYYIFFTSNLCQGRTFYASRRRPRAASTSWQIDHTKADCNKRFDLYAYLTVLL